MDNLIVQVTDSLTEAYNELFININEKDSLTKLAGKLSLIEEDLSHIRNLLDSERSALKDLKQSLQPLAGFFSVPTVAAGSGGKKVKTVNFAAVTQNTSDPSSSVTVTDTIPHVTPQEFESLPKYLKGRLNVAKVNALVNDFNRFIAEKYSLLARANPAKLSLDQRQRYMEWRDAEIEETAGKFFITEADLKAKSAASGYNNGFKFDQVTRNILTILRQLGRIKEHRSSGNIIRYIVNNN